jgi:uncharacterized membrane protein (DUF106 family)
MSDNKKSVAPVKQVQAAKPTRVKKTGTRATVDRIILYAGILIFILSMLLPPAFRNGIAALVNVIAAPLASNMPFYVAILIMTTFISIVSALVQKYTTDWEFVRGVNRNMQALNKELREARLSGDKKRLKKLEEQQSTLMADQAEMSKETMKPTFYLIFVSLPILYWEYWYLAQPAQAGLSMYLPFMGYEKLTSVFFILPYWLIWSLICSLAISFIIRKALNIAYQD